MVKEKFARLFSGFDIVDFVTCKEWGNNTREDYYKYFDDADKEMRAGSLLAFACMLGNWHYGSGIVFHYGGEMFSPREPFYKIDNYLSAYLTNKLSIKREFPVLHKYILSYLNQFDKDFPYKYYFPEEEKEPFLEMRRRIFQDEFIPADSVQLPEIQKLLNELDILKQYF